MEEYHAAPQIVSPFGLFDCSLRSDAAGAVIVTSRERARDLRQPPVLDQGLRQRSTISRGWFADDNMVVTAAKKSGETAYRMAGLGPDDVDTAQIYDCFTYMVLTQLEDYGFCKKGEGGAFVASGALRMGGAAADQHVGRPALRGACRRHAAGGRGRAPAAPHLSGRAAGEGRRDCAGVRPWRQPGLPFHADSGERRDEQSRRQAGKPVPRPAPESVPYWAGRPRASPVELPRCNACGKFWFPPSRSCPHCLAADFAFAAGVGPRQGLQLRHLPPRLSSGLRAGEVPYVVALVELEEGPRLLSNIVGVDPQAVRCEMPVKVVFDDVGDATIPKFRPRPA